MEAPIAEADVACPLETQRSIPGLILKLFIVHFVTLCFYFHCYHQREGRYLTVDALIFLTAPLNTVFRYAVALLGILGYLCCTLAYSFSVNNPQYYRRKVLKISRNALSALLGRKRSTGNHLYSTVLGNAPKPPWSERVVGRIGPIIPALAFITQCCGAIYLYQRRRQFHGVTLIDEQIFAQACGGLVIGLLSAGYTLQLPFFDDVVTDSRDTYLGQFIHALRDQADDEEFYTGGVEEWRLFIYFCKAFSIIFTIQLLLRNPETNTMYFFWASIAAMSFILYLGVACFQPEALFITATVHNAPLYQRVWHALRAFCINYFGPLLAVIISQFPLWGFFWQLFALVDLRAQAGELKNVPFNKPCPLLQMDPVAEYIWWLA